MGGVGRAELGGEGSAKACYVFRDGVADVRIAAEEVCTLRPPPLALNA